MKVLQKLVSGSDILLASGRRGEISKCQTWMFKIEWSLSYQKIPDGTCTSQRRI